MRHLLRALLVAAAIAAMYSAALAGNQEVASQIAESLQDSGQLKDFKIGVKVQDGVAWLKGRVADQEQVNHAMRIAYETAGVSRVINGLDTNSQENSVSPQTDATLPVPTSENSRSLIPGRPTSVQRLQAVIAGARQEPAQVASGRHVEQTAAATRRQVPVAQPRMATSQSAGQPIPVAYLQPAPALPGQQAAGGPLPAYVSAAGGSVSPARYDQPQLPNYAWPSYAAYPNYAALTYPKQYSPTAWPYIGPFYPYPQVPLGWRKVTLEWDDGWWMLDFKE